MTRTDRNLSRDEIVERSRSRKGDAEGEDTGIRLPASEPSMEGGTGFAGVGQPVVPPAQRGEPASPLPLPGDEEEDGSAD